MLRKEPLPLFEIMSLEEMVAGSRFTADDLCDYSVGVNDGRVYLLFGREADRAEKTTYSYAVVGFDVDWEAGRCLGRQVYDLGAGYQNEYGWVLALGDDFLLVWCRCWYNEGNPERNGLLVGRDGTIRRDYCFGDGIENCLVLKDGTIVTNYGDEGVYGNYGWGGQDPGSRPIGRTGLVVWGPDGGRCWEGSESDGCCEAIGRDAEGQLWLYRNGVLARWDSFRDRNQESVSLLGIAEVRDSEAFAVGTNGRRLLFDGGYGDFYRRFFILSCDGSTGRVEAEAVPMLNGVPIAPNPYYRENNLSDHRTLWLTDRGILCGSRFV